MVLSRDQLGGVGVVVLYLLCGWVGVGKSDDMRKRGCLGSVCFLSFSKIKYKSKF